MASSKQGIFLSQRMYMFFLLKEMTTLGCKPMSTPIDQNHQIGQESKEGVSIDKGLYRQLVGRLIYLSHTRLDVAYFVSVVS